MLEIFLKRIMREFLEKPRLEVALDVPIRRHFRLPKNSLFEKHPYFDND